MNLIENSVKLLLPLKRSQLHSLLFSSRLDSTYMTVYRHCMTSNPFSAP